MILDLTVKVSELLEKHLNDAPELSLQLVKLFADVVPTQIPDDGIAKSSAVDLATQSLAAYIAENRAVIYYGQLLAATGDDEDRKRTIMREMEGTNLGQVLLLRMNADSRQRDHDMLDRADELAK